MAVLTVYTTKRQVKHVVKSYVQLKVVFYTKWLCHGTVLSLHNSLTGLKITVFKPLSRVIKYNENIAFSINPPSINHPSAAGV